MLPHHIARPVLSLPPVLALDLGGTRIRAAVIQPDGARIARTETPTPTSEGPSAIVAACSAMLERARDSAATDVAAALAGIGVSSPGPVDPARGVVVEPPNLGQAFHDVPLARAVGDALGLPAFLDRDTNVAALGERAFGAAIGCDDFIYLTVSTGVGGAIVTGGALLHGPDGLAGELGHVPVSLDGPRCGCGGIGHVEAYASGAALAREARLLVIAGRSPFLAGRARSQSDPDGLSARDVAEGALAGDPACAELMALARRAVATACVGYANTFNPHRIVVGGSIAEAEGDRLLDPIRTAIATEAFQVIARQIRVVPAALRGDVSLAGAHPLVMSRLAQERGAGAQPAATHRPAEPVGTLPRR
ncbi:MAG: ROK family protein [Candidatus Limnocylindrales bacterium]